MTDQHDRPATRPRPFKGSLYKRRNGRYIPAGSGESGIYYLEIPSAASPGGRVRVCLHTESRAEAEARAHALTASPAIIPPHTASHFACPYFWLANACPPPAPHPAPPPAIPRVMLADVWFLFTRRHEVAFKSLKCYRHQLDSFLKWTPATHTDEVTREMAEEYTRHIFHPKKGLPSARQMRYSVTFNERLRGWVKFPTGGKARDCLAIARH